MGPLYLLLGSCTALAYLYEHSYVSTLQGPKKSRFIYFVLMTILICFGGFRGQYNDTWTYRDVYTYVVNPFPEAWDTIPTELGENPAFFLVMSFLKTYNVEVHLFLFFFFFWTTLFFMKFIKKYASNFTLTIYFFITMGSYLFNMAAIKQCMATAICLVAIPFAIDKKWIRYFLLVCIASLFHPYAFLYLIVPLMDFQPWKKWSYVLLAIILLGGYLFQPMLGTIIDITTAIGENYTTEALSGEGINILRLIAVWSPVVLSFLYRDTLFRDCTREERIFANLTMVFRAAIKLLFYDACDFRSLDVDKNQKISSPRWAHHYRICSYCLFCLFLFFQHIRDIVFKFLCCAFSDGVSKNLF